MYGRPSWNGHFEATFLKSGGGDRVKEQQEVTDQLTSSYFKLLLSSVV